MTKLGDVCTIVSGTTPKTSVSEYWDGDINWITPAELNEDTVVINESKRKITKAGVNSCGLSPFPAGTVILSSRAPIGKTAIAGTEMYCNQGFKNLICSDKIHNKYLFWFLRSKTEMLNSLGRGATFKEISKSIVENIEIPLPDLPTQQRIADTLDKVSEGIEVCRRILGELDLMVKAKFGEMFGDPVSNEREWNVETLNDVCTEIGDGLHGTPEYDDNGEYPFINGNNLINGAIEITPATKKVNAEIYKKHYIGISANALLLSINGTLGKLAFYNGEKVMLGKSACYCNFKPEINRAFVYGVMKTEAFAGFLEKSATASTIKNVGLKAIRGYKLIMPPQALQMQFIEFSNQVDKSKLAVKQSLEKLETLKKSLMQEYLG